MNIPTKVTFVAAVFCAAISLPAFSNDTISVTHAQGTTEVSTNPQKVITFDLATLDMMSTLDIDVFGVPTAVMPSNLKAYEGEEFEKFGSLFEPDYEAINAAQPDLIIVAGRSSGAYAELSKIAPTIDLSNDWADFIPSIKGNAQILGQIFDRENEVDEMEAQFEASVSIIQQQAEDLGRVFVVMTNAGRVTAYGAGSRFGFVHDTFGLTPAIDDVEAATHGEAISNEFILQTNPDWLIVLDRDAAIGSDSGESARATLDNELVAQTNAWASDQVFYADSARWYITNGGLSNMQEIVDALGAAMLAAE